MISYLFCPISTFADCDIVLSEVLANPSTTESTDEAIELYNRGDVAVDLSGWRIIEPEGDELNDTIQDFAGPYDVGLSGSILAPGGYALIVDPQYEGAHNSTFGQDPSFIMLQAHGDTTLGNGLANRGDDIGLDNGSGCAPRFIWPDDAGNGISWEKIDLEGDDSQDNWAPNRWQGHTLGIANSVMPAPSPHARGSVLINEFLYDAVGVDNGAEWIELYNTTGDGIDLTHWTLESAGSSFQILISISSGIIPSHGYFVLSQSTSVPADTFYSASATLQNGGANADGLRLRDPSGKVQDAVIYAGLTNQENRLQDEDLVPVADDQIAPSSKDGASLARKRDAQDSGNSALDFLEDASPTPRASNDPREVLVSPDDRFVPPGALPEASGGSLLVEVLEPNPFTPYETTNNLGRIRFSASEGTVKNIRLFDVQGRKVAVLVDHDQMRDGTSLAGIDQGMLLWDGTDDTNARLPMGIYVIYFEAKDSGGKVVGKETDTIILGRRL